MTGWSKLSAIFLAALVWGFGSESATAHPNPHERCGEHKILLQRFLEGYGELPIALGLSLDGNVVEVLTTENGETWTILIVAPTGIACMTAAGVSWQPLEAASGDKESFQLNPRDPRGRHALN